MRDYYRPLVRSDAPRPEDARPLAGGPRWFSHAARHRRDGSVTRVPASEIPGPVLERLTTPRAPLLALLARCRAHPVSVLPMSLP